MPPDPGVVGGSGAFSEDDRRVDVKIEKNKPDLNGDVVEFIFFKTDWYVLYQSAGQIRYALPKSVVIASRYRASVNTLAGLKASIDGSRSWFRPKYADDPTFRLDSQYIRSARARLGLRVNDHLRPRIRRR